MINNAEQTRKFMESVKKGNLKFKVDEDVEKRLLKEEQIKEVWNTSTTPDCYADLHKLIKEYGISNVTYSLADYFASINDMTIAKKLYDIPLN